MSTDNPRQRPFKVWSADRSLRKGVIAYSLIDLIRKGRVKLDIQEGESIAVVLEADGTEVDDEYFKRLEENTVVLFLKVGERWYPPGVEAIRAVSRLPKIGCSTLDVTDAGSSTVDTVAQLLTSLRQNLSAVFYLSVEELELLADMNVESYSVNSEDLEFLKRLRDTCCRICVERKEATEAMQVLQLWKQSTAFGLNKRLRGSSGDVEDN